MPANPARQLPRVWFPPSDTHMWHDLCALVAPFARRTCAHCDDGFRFPTCQCARHGTGMQVCACTMCVRAHTRRVVLRL
jgi:hypothetical protein